MVDELTVSLRELGANVVVISPYYHVDRKGKGDYLSADGIVYTGRNVSVWVGSEKLTLGVHEGTVNGVHLFFLHHSEVFPRWVARARPDALVTRSCRVAVDFSMTAASLHALPLRCCIQHAHPPHTHAHNTHAPRAACLRAWRATPACARPCPVPVPADPTPRTTPTPK
jgi:hypothetical protein